MLKVGRYQPQKIQSSHLKVSMIVVRAVAYPQRQKQGITDADLYMIRKRTSIIEDKKDINSHFLKKKSRKASEKRQNRLGLVCFHF